MHGGSSKILHSTKQFNVPCYLSLLLLLFLLIRSHILLNVITVIGENNYFYLKRDNT